MELKTCATKYDLKEEKYGHTAFQHPQVRPRTLLIKSDVTFTTKVRLKDQKIRNMNRPKQFIMSNILMITR